VNEIALAQPNAPVAVAESAPVPQTLFNTAHVDSRSPSEAPQWMPAKFHVRGADGGMDLAASSQKLAQAYDHAVRRFGTSDTAPDNPSAYTLTVPDHLQLDLPEDARESLQPFMERAHEAGLSQAQMDFVMGEYFGMMPALSSDAAAVKLEDAKAELAQAWKTPEEMQRNLLAAERAVAAVPPDLQNDVKARFGTDPVFWKFAAEFGKEVGEDRPAAPPGGTQGGSDVDTLMRSEAYRNAKHPDHAKVSAQVRQAIERQVGTNPIYE
jgi:hypothetical protein